MSWLRIDDGFTKHPKILQLTVRQRWLWLDLLCWCARYKTNGLIPDGALAELRIRSSDINGWASAGLVDREDSTLAVHDWAVYNPADPTAADRVRRHRDRNNDRNGAVTEPVTVTGPPRAGTRARTRPVPVPSSSGSATPTEPSPTHVASTNGNGGGGDMNRLDPYAVLGMQP